MGHVDIGKFAAGHRRPTIPPAPGVEDVEADRRTVLGNVFPIPRTERHSAEWRRHVVDAAGLLLQQAGGRGWMRRRAAAMGRAGGQRMVGTEEEGETGG